MIRETIANSFIAAGRLIGKFSGLELAVELSDHSIEAKMEQTDTDKRAWDPDLYKSGNVFAAGYANPIKPRVRHNDELENPNELGVQEGNPESGDTENNNKSVQMIANGRYRKYMRQDLVSQLLTPESRWNMLVWAVTALGVAIFTNMLITLWATGSF